MLYSIDFLNLIKIRGVNMSVRSFLVSSTIIIATSTIAFIGCGGADSLLKVKTMKKIALVQIASNRIIEMSSEDEGGTGSEVQSTIKMFKSLSKGKSFKEAFEDAEHSSEKAFAGCIEHVITNLNASPALPLLPINSVLENENYQKVEDNKYTKDKLRSADNFRIPLLRDNAEIATELCNVLGAEALLTVNIEFKKNIVAGIGSSGAAKARIRVTLRLWDAAGEVIWYDNETEQSDKSIGIISGAYDFDKMDVLAIDGVDRATKRMLKKLEKKLAKAGE